MAAYMVHRREMTVAAEQDDAFEFLLFDPVEELVALAEIHLPRIIGAEGLSLAAGGEELDARFAGGELALQPGKLFVAEHGLLRAVLRLVGRAVIPAVEHEVLHV